MFMNVTNESSGEPVVWWEVMAQPSARSMKHLAANNMLLTRSKQPQPYMGETLSSKHMDPVT